MRSAREAFRHQEGELQRLAGVEPRIAMGVIAVFQIVFGDLLRPAQAFGDVLAGHLEMHAARMGAFGAMHSKKVFTSLRMRSKGRVL